MYGQPVVPHYYMQSLQELVCRQCGLSGYLPGQWGGMRLQYADLSNNMLVGAFSTFGSSTLRSLFLDNNPLGSQLWPSAFNESSLEILSLSGCHLGGTIPGVGSKHGLAMLGWLVERAESCGQFDPV